MKRMRSVVLAAWLLAAVLGSAGARAQVATTIVQDTVTDASGAPAQGTVVVSWVAFTTAAGVSVPVGSLSTTLGAGGALSVALQPNAGATPMGSYYTAVYHLSDGTTSREFWVVPVAVPGGGPAKLAGIRNQVLPTSVAMQTVSKQYVDTTVARAVAAASTSGTAGGDLSGSYPNPAVTAVHATAGALDGVTIGGTTPAAGSFTSLSASTFGTFATGSGGGLSNYLKLPGAAQPTYVATIVQSQAAVLSNCYFDGSNWVYATTGYCTAFRMNSTSAAGGAGASGFVLVLAPSGAAGSAVSNMDTTDAGLVALPGNHFYFNPGAAGPVSVATDVIVANAARSFVVDTNGNVTGTAFHETLSTPASSAAACSAGDFSDDANFHYVCVGANSWKRVALGSF